MLRTLKTILPYLEFAKLICQCTLLQIALQSLHYELITCKILWCSKKLLNLRENHFSEVSWKKLFLESWPCFIPRRNYEFPFRGPRSLILSHKLILRIKTHTQQLWLAMLLSKIPLFRPLFNLINFAIYGNFSFC